ncbi:MAG: type II toxin-antitoxin system RelE/ParE family toxin [Chitinophagaceae bacterium]|nr:type II toxin-antitoxin system RelE/ParE family toxin [Chitinophagaceae bacterium]
MRINYRISEKAIEDLENVWLYTLESWSVEQADRYYNLLIEEIKYLSGHFESGKSMEHIKQGYRASKVKSHLIFYKKAKDNIVEIVRILHQRMDIENRLK